jgi:2-amino-4-hydroxy-6-hydroxymethyldihydropteridine diphosphokinase
MSASAFDGVMSAKAKVVLSFGSNIHPRREYLERAMAGVCAYPQTRLLAAGEIEETEPVGVPPEYRDLKFLNQVAVFETGLGPMEFSRLMHKSEDELGRVRAGVRNAPRTIDIDMIDYDGMVLDDPRLRLPHPRARERDFVFRPWMELEKRLIRQEMKRLRAEVSAAERAEKSRELCRILSTRLEGAATVCIYHAMKTELDLSEFERECLDRGVRVTVPERDGVGYAVPHCGEVDLWVCPGLAFTAAGERLGFGGGWYDRFLAAAKPSARTCGVAYSFQMKAWLPQEKWDCRLDEVITV